MWILTQKRDRLINIDNVKQIRVMEDGEIHADGITLGKYRDAKKILEVMCVGFKAVKAISAMPEDSPDA